jgi:cell division protein FtsI (penicillin-binding protein 3)
MRNLGGKRARWIRVRMGVLCGIMGLALGVIVSSAYRVQVDDGAAWRELAEKQRQRRLHVQPKRGSVFDRNGQPLAVSVEVPSIVADAAEMVHGVDGDAAQKVVLEDAAVRIGAALSIDSRELYAKLATRRRFIWLKRRASSEEAAAIRDLSDPKKQMRPIHGLAIEGEGHRYYPGRELLGTVLGFVAPDGLGKDGLELALDDELRGHVEEVQGLRDRNGHLLFEGQMDEQALAGHDVTLTIDSAIQHLAQQELDAAMSTYETKGGSVIVMDPNTGELLALASTPGYNPNDYSQADPDTRRDRAVTDRFEPGSVMKIFTLSAAFAQGVLQPTETINCEHGSFRVGNVTIHDTHLNDFLTPTQILAKSSNIGALKIGLRLGEPGLYAALRRFGFGEPTGLPLPGEASGVLRSRGRPWVDVETANASFGQGISVTAIQLATALSAVANGGKLLEPLLVKRITTSTGEVVREGTTHVRRETVPTHVTKLMAEMLTAVTEDGGTGVEAAVPGFRVAGKTATAQKVDPKTGKYSQDKFTASFIGFVPARRPRIVVVVVLDEPMIGHYGGDLAGPVFRRVAEGTLRYLGVTPSEATKKVSVSRSDDPADKVIAAYRAAESTAAAAPQPVAQVTLAAQTPSAGIAVPDVGNMGARDAVRAMLGAGLLPQVEGSGHAVRQAPAAGTIVPKGSAVRLSFEQSS